MTLIIDSLSYKRDDQTILYNINFLAQEGKILCLLGPSGSGKTTLLRLIAGLEDVQEGYIKLNDNIIASKNTNLPAEDRSVGFVFQENILFPHLTVSQNIEFGIQSFDYEERKRIVTQSLEDMGLPGFENRYPETLSGGEKQRVALVQSLARSPKIMLLDEPFSNVDPQLRTELRHHTRQLLVKSNAVSIIVTHDPMEALDIADFIGIVGGGKIYQIDTPQNIWTKPLNKQVITSLGECQRIKVKYRDGALVGTFGLIEKLFKDEARLPEVFIRPNSFIFSKVKTKDKDIKVIIDSILFRGNYTAILFSYKKETFIAFVDRDMDNINIGDEIFIIVDCIKYYIF